MKPQEKALLARKGIIVPPEVVEFYKPAWHHDFDMAMDAQPALVTQSNSGIPSYLTNYIDPKFIEIFTSPNKGALVLGEVKKGDWTMLTTTFTVVESTGEVASYGDRNDNGSTGTNFDFPQRQSYYFQTITQWGERELEMAGLAKIDTASRLNVASGKVIDKFMNKSYFFGLAGLQNYGILNDPQLTTPLTPSTKAAGGTTWAVGTPNEIFADIQAMFKKLQAQSGGVLEAEDPMKLCLSPTAAVGLLNTNSFGLNVYGMIKQGYPKLTVVTAVEYTTVGGEVVQLIAEDIEGQETGYCAFSEKMRAHRIVPDMSSFKQKKSAGTWGAIIFYPLAIAQMLGI